MTSNLFDFNLENMINSHQLGRIRWIALVGQVLAIALVHFYFGFAMPIVGCSVVIGLSVALGIGHFFYHRKSVIMTNAEVFVLLSLDTLQLASLLYLTGGLVNPFAMMFLAPVTISAALLPKAETAGLVLLVTILASILSFYHVPLPWGGSPLILPPLYTTGLWVALLLTVIFVGVYAAILTGYARKLAKGLNRAQLVLAREQQMVALGSFAAVAAHKLGSPLNTITLIAHDLEVNTSQGKDKKALADDIKELKEETERCRNILTEINDEAIVFEYMAEEAIDVETLVTKLINERFFDIKEMLTVIVDNPENLPAPKLVRSPNILHGLEMVIDNAIQFAENHVNITLSYYHDKLCFIIDDDGPGFTASALISAGKPYNSTRQDEDGHMGFGLFFVHTVIESIGGYIAFRNCPNKGARVTITLPLEEFAD